MPYLVEIMKSSINKEVVIKIGLKVVIIRFFKKIKSWEVLPEDSAGADQVKKRASSGRDRCAKAQRELLDFQPASV